MMRQGSSWLLYPKPGFNTRAPRSEQVWVARVRLVADPTECPALRLTSA